MKQNEIYFGEVGLTSTSANHIANLCKEQYLSTEQLLSNVRFYNEDIAIIGEQPTRLKQGWNDILLSGAIELLDDMTNYKSLIAWLREGIKAKEALLKEAKSIELDEWAEQQGIAIPERPTDSPKQPVRESKKTRDDILAIMTVKERNRILYLETLVAVYGKYIHVDGEFSTARKLFEKHMNEPNKVEGSGRDTIIHSFTSSVEREEIDEMFFTLQNLHREAQAELNGIYYRIDKEIEDDGIRIDVEYSAKYSLFQEELMQWNAKSIEWQAQISTLTAQMEEWRSKEVQRISQLKIIIPNDLKETYEKINSLGKQ